MNLPDFSFCCFIVFVLLWCEAESRFAPNSGDYIKWDDLFVNNNQSYNGDRVIIVDKNGRGDSRTVQGAVTIVPFQNSHRVKIHILPGVYREKVHIPSTKPYISLIGDISDPSRTVITWQDKASDPDGRGGSVGTSNSSSVTVKSDYFCAAGITIQNTVIAPTGEVDGYQAVAMRILGDKSVFYKVNFLGTQDTLLDDTGRHYFFKCFIQGATDFIFGSAKSLYQGRYVSTCEPLTQTSPMFTNNLHKPPIILPVSGGMCNLPNNEGVVECTISVVNPGYSIAAQGRILANHDTGFSFVNCTVTGKSVAGVYLGRAWADYSKIVYSKCKFDTNVIPAGWDDFGVPSRQSTGMFGEYQCTGKGANTNGRVQWSRVLSSSDAKPFMDTSFINGRSWLRL